MWHETLLVLVTYHITTELATTSMTGGDETLKGELFRAMIRAANIAGEIYLATDPSSNKIVAFTLWFPPGTSLFDSEEQRALGFDDFMNKISPETKAFWENAVRFKVTLRIHYFLNFHLEHTARGGIFNGHNWSQCTLRYCFIHRKLATIIGSAGLSVL
jgi:hypothetical protein